MKAIGLTEFGGPEVDRLRNQAEQGILTLRVADVRPAKEAAEAHAAGSPREASAAAGAGLLPATLKILF